MTPTPLHARPATAVCVIRLFAIFSLSLNCLLLCSPAMGAEPEEELSPAAVRFFETRVRPVLADQCFDCHSASAQESGLRLDSRHGAVLGGDRGPALIAGQPDKSLLIQAIGYDDTDLAMPPKKKLTKEQIADLTEWIRLGAPWPGGGVAPEPAVERAGFQVTAKDRAHWSFQPVQRPAPPVVKHADWVNNPIDAFVLARLESKGLSPNPPASPRALIRRLHYDLTGLPPSPEEVEAFASDPSEDAYQKRVDALLDSPQYAEKWARHWLDLVRFAETNSYERDDPKPFAWRYRDYVIRSFERDKPYDQFIREQLAGDELSEAGHEALIATGYYRLGIWNDEPSDRELAYYDELDDIVATTGQVFLGLTIDCARCHDHKLDPIAQQDYYSLLAFFRNLSVYRNGSDGGNTNHDLAAFAEGPNWREEAARRLKALEAQRESLEQSLIPIRYEFRKRYPQTQAPPPEPDLVDLRYSYFSGFTRQASIVGPEKAAFPDFQALVPTATGALPGGLFDLGPRREDGGTAFVFEGTLVVPRDGTYTFEIDPDDAARLSIDGKKVLEFDIVYDRGQRQASVTLAGGRVPIKLEFSQTGGALRLMVAWSGPGLERRLLSTPPEHQQANYLDEQSIQQGPKVLGPELFARYQKILDELQAVKQSVADFPRALCVTESGGQVTDTHLLFRGNPSFKGDKVEPGFPQVFGVSAPSFPQPAPDARTTGRRRVLADWIASADNPLTARVVVNRIWQHHFGRGIVRSANDFGLQGDRPTHPELLDWLAAEFVEQGWRWKPMHRLIVTSSAYRQSSQDNPASLAADPSNDLWWRFDMRRLTAEEVRDSILAVTDTLNSKRFGPGVYPPIPKEVLAGQSEPGRGWGTSPPEEQARRSIYIHVKRSLLTPILQSFDLADTDRSAPVRFATTQPTQALGMLNSEFLGNQATAFALRLRKEAGDDVDQQVRRALALATGRPATVAEVERGVALVESLQTKDGMSAEAALSYFCLMVLNLNEFIYVN